MAKPWYPTENRPNTPEGTGDRGAEEGVVVEEVKAGGTQGEEAEGTPPPPKKAGPAVRTPQGHQEWGR